MTCVANDAIVLYPCHVGGAGVFPLTRPGYKANVAKPDGVSCFIDLGTQSSSWQCELTMRLSSCLFPSVVNSFLIVFIDYVMQ